MTTFQFAIASIVDANTGNGLARGTAGGEYSAAERHGRKIRSQSILRLLASIKTGIAGTFMRFRAEAEMQRDLRRLLALDDHLLEDIGLHRGDLEAVRLGIISLDELHDQQRAGKQDGLTRLRHIADSSQIKQNLAASNELLFDQRKCA